METNILCFNFADLILQLQFSFDRSSLFISKPYLAFLASDKLKPDFKISIELSTEKIEYNKSYKTDWIFSKKDNFYFINYKSPRNNYIAYQLLMPAESNNWILKVFNSENKINPFIHPLGSLILKKILLKNSAFFIHGSGINFNGKGIIFTGRAGVGKSTIAEIFKDSSKHIHDDRLIIRKIGNNYRMYNSPMINVIESKSSDIDIVYSVNHGEKNEIFEINKIKVINEIIPNIAQHNIDNTCVDLLYNSFFDFCKHIKCYKLKFKAEKDIINFLQNNLTNV